MFEHYAHKLYINAAAMLSTVGLSLMSIMDVLDGVLPTISLLLTTITTAILAVYWVEKVRREHLEIRKLKAELEESLKVTQKNTK